MTDEEGVAVSERARLTQAMRETRDYLECNRDWDEDNPITDDDVLDELDSACGRMPDGSCSLAGTEHCDWRCPFS